MGAAAAELSLALVRSLGGLLGRSSRVGFFLDAGGRGTSLVAFKSPVAKIPEQGGCLSLSFFCRVLSSGYFPFRCAERHMQQTAQQQTSTPCRSLPPREEIALSTAPEAAHDTYKTAHQGPPETRRDVPF